MGDPLDPTVIVAAAVVVVVIVATLGHRPAPTWRNRSRRRPAGLRFWSPWRVYLGALAVLLVLETLGDMTEAPASTTRPPVTVATTTEVAP